MRPPQKNNRPRGRSRGKNSGNSANRVYESAGPEGKVRGTPQQIIEKYLTLARDAQTSDDRVVAENFLQHAEHYQRILIQANVSQQQSPRRDGTEGTGEQATMVSQENSIGQSVTLEVKGLTTIDAQEESGRNMLLEENLSSGDSTRLKRVGSDHTGDDEVLESGRAQPEV